MIRMSSHADGKAQTTIVWDANDIFMRPLHGHIRIELKQYKHVLTVALITHKATSLRHKFDENMKGDSELLIIEATFGFCLLCYQWRREARARQVKWPGWKASALAADLASALAVFFSFKRNKCA